MLEVMNQAELAKTLDTAVLVTELRARGAIGGRVAGCRCGECATCRTRERVRLHRQQQAEAKPKRRGRRAA